MQIVLIAGQARSGKTTLAKAIAREGFNRGFIPVVELFAMPIKEAAEEKGLCKTENPQEYRKFCQDFGSRCRKDDIHFFVRQAEERVKEYAKLEAADIAEGKKHWERLIIFDDARYPNELKFGKTVDGITFFISRGDKLPDRHGKWRNHESEYLSRIVDGNGFESHFDDVFDIYIVNDSDEAAIEKDVHKEYANWMGIHQPEYLSSCDEDTCDCIICAARREGRTPDPTEILEYILWRLTGEGLSPEQREEMDRDIEDGYPPGIDIDISIHFDEEEPDEDA